MQDKHFFEVKRFISDLFLIGDGHVLLGGLWCPIRRIQIQSASENYIVPDPCSSNSPSLSWLTIAGLANLFDGLFRAKRLAQEAASAQKEVHPGLLSLFLPKYGPFGTVYFWRTYTAVLATIRMD
jgi:hypothetical protein